MRRRKPRVINNEKYPSAAITFEQIAGAWFIHDQQIYPVASAPIEVFRSAVLEIAPEYWGNAAAQELFKGKVQLDSVDRWFILDALAEKQCTLQLYKSREQTEQAMSDQVQMDQATAAL